MQIKELSSKQVNRCSKDKYDELLKKLRKDGEKLIKGMFEFTDAGGGYLEFSYRFFPGEPIRTVRLDHGEICDLPMHLVKHLNNTFKKIRMMPREISINGGRVMENAPTQKTSRVKFIPIDVT